MNNFEKPTPENENPYFVMPERVEIDRLSLSNNHLRKYCFLIIILILIGFPGFIIAAFNPAIMIFIIILFISLIIFMLFNCKSKIELIKDKSNNRITVMEKNCICCKKILNLPLKYTVLTAKNYGIECTEEASIIFALNIDPNVIDLDNSKIRNTPFKFIYQLNKVNVKIDQLELQLKNLSEAEFKNNFKEELYLYIPKQNFKQVRYSKSLYDLYDKYFVKISDHFYMFYTHPYLEFNKSNEAFGRLDWIYTKNFDRIFIGVVKDDSSYFKNFIFNTDTIDKFVFEIFGEYFCLKIILKTGERTEICNFLKEIKMQLEVFINFINGQINKINNVNQVITDNSAPTIK
jgi:hypothetical protein